MNRRQLLAGLAAAPLVGPAVPSLCVIDPLARLVARDSPFLTRAALYSLCLGTGWLTRADVRRIEGLPQ